MNLTNSITNIKTYDLVNESSSSIHFLLNHYYNEVKTQSITTTWDLV